MIEIMHLLQKGGASSADGTFLPKFGQFSGIFPKYEPLLGQKWDARLGRSAKTTFLQWS